jgi:hypothetical protein
VNPFARLIDPSEPVPQPHTLNGFVHILADEIDHTTMQPASKPGPKQEAAALQRPVVGFPRFEVQYQRDESVCLVATPSGTLITEVYFPVVCWVPTAPTKAEPNRRAKGQS